VHEQQPFAPRRFGAGGELRAAPARRGDDAGAGRLCQTCGAVARAAIGDDDLAEESRRRQRAQRLRQTGGRVERRDDGREAF
jgi:hypothetical protein